jgi:hypothetical protein
MPEDIRDQPYLSHDDVVRLNFIKETGRYLFRRHYRVGLRSHIMEVLNRDEVEKEREGITINGLRWFPQAKPIKMLRIFRTKFPGLRDAKEELERVKVIELFLGSSHIAVSNEFLVDYVLNAKRNILLCGLQEYVEGEILDPWAPIDEEYLAGLFHRMGKSFVKDSKQGPNLLFPRLQKEAEAFVKRVKKMILEGGHIPDLSGIGNLLLTIEGGIKLVDINNISKVSFTSMIPIDDRGYPVCDKSIQALSHLEEKLLGENAETDTSIYSRFLDPQRVKEVKAIERTFHESMNTTLSSYR